MTPEKVVLRIDGEQTTLVLGGDAREAVSTYERLIVQEVMHGGLDATRRARRFALRRNLARDFTLTLSECQALQ